MQQIVLENRNPYDAFKVFFLERKIKRPLFVHGNSFLQTDLYKIIRQLHTEEIIHLAEFSAFSPNPSYEEVKAGVSVYRNGYCDGIIAAGGGSCMDVAKCIKLFANLEEGSDYLKQEWNPDMIPILAIPTTSGSGSEATRYAVIYREGEKQSVTSESCIPDAVYFDAGLLLTLPTYQKKATMLDALCHSMESYWSVNSTQESMDYSREAICLILENYKKYFEGDMAANEKMMHAANLAGRAINITQTTAGHALCYQLTKRYGYAHGHAAALCDVWLWQYMYSHKCPCRDRRGFQYLTKIFLELAELWGCETIPEGIEAFRTFVEKLSLSHDIPEEDIPALVGTVNRDRLGNHPVVLDEADIRSIYLAVSTWKEQ